MNRCTSIQMREHGRPYLPLDGVLVLAEEVLELERLLEFLEEQLHRPAGLVYRGDGHGT